MTASLRLHHQPFWSNSAHSPRASKTKYDSHLLQYFALLLLCCRVYKREIHYVICVTSRDIFEYNFWVHLKFLRYFLPRCFTHLSCRSICHRICNEAMDVWTPEICVHLAVKAIDDIALKTNSCWKSLVWIYLPQFSWQTSFCHTLVSSLDPTDVSNFCAWPRQQPFQAPGFRSGFSIMWM